MLCIHGASATEKYLTAPKPGDQTLRILSPNLLELVLINTKQPDPARVDNWDWVDDQGNFIPPDLSSVKVIVNGQTNSVTTFGFKRRPLYSTVEPRDLRIGNYLYLQLNSPIFEGQSVEVINDGTLWPTNREFAAAMASLKMESPGPFEGTAKDIERVMQHSERTMPVV